MKASDPRVLKILLDRWSKLSADDERNFGFDRAADLLGPECCPAPPAEGGGRNRPENDREGA